MVPESKPRYEHVYVEDVTIEGWTLSFTRHDGVRVSVTGAEREDLEFMAAEEQSAGNTPLARELHELARDKHKNTRRHHRARAA